MEQPNLEYINRLARGDETIKKELINIIKTEFPEEKKEYYASIESGVFKIIEENVHRLKHKISILGLVKNYEIANEFETNLRKLDLNGQEDFEKILRLITRYIKTI
jgi:HPt (histidine-containing phosphotransfer) domain-containing protein